MTLSASQSAIPSARNLCPIDVKVRYNMRFAALIAAGLFENLYFLSSDENNCSTPIKSSFSSTPLACFSRSAIKLSKSSPSSPANASRMRFTRSKSTFSNASCKNNPVFVPPGNALFTRAFGTMGLSGLLPSASFAPVFWRFNSE